MIVGPLLEAVADVAVGTSAAASDSDISIGDLGFHLAISDERPYQRATAQFRKEQFDSSQNPGDQSLTGWWTRGQLSFHKGAGVNYYELSAGESVLNRYKEATGVDPWTPGELTLAPAWSSATSTPHTDTVAVAPVGDKIAVHDGGSVYYGSVGGAGTAYSPLPASVTSMAVGNGDIFCALSNNTISRIGLAETVVSVYGEQGFEADSDSWFSNNALGNMATATSVAQSSTFAFEGTKSLKITWPAPGGTSGQSGAWRQIDNLTIGAAYTAVMKVYVPAGNPDVAAIALFAGQGTTVTAKGAWTTAYVNFTAYASQMFVGVVAPTPVSGQACYVDKVVIYQGTQTGYVTPGTIPTDVIYSHTQAIVRLFYAKDRLFVVDASNQWYQLAPNPTAALPVAIGSGDKVFKVGGDRTWSVTDTPGPVLLGNNNRIFAVSVDASGAIPTLSGPIQVADLPEQEQIRALAYHLGFVIIVTSSGVRVAALADNGSVTYGPRLIEWTETGGRTSIGRYDSRVIVAGGHKAYEIDLSEQIGNALEFGYTELPNPFAGTEDNYGISVAPDLSLVAWGDNLTVRQSTSLAATGSLTTGYHRFSTLEPKRFESVKVRARGTGGTITVSKVDLNGSETSLYTLDVSQDHEVDLGLAMNVPAEAVALKFTLARSAGDATVGPTLLGYQLRALPQPKRQRMIRLPLMMHDVERKQPGRATGHTGAAWEHLRALEDLESSGETVIFRDNRTGESASVYVESVEFSNTTPPSAKGTGFGGICFLTIRKL